MAEEKTLQDRYRQIQERVRAATAQSGRNIPVTLIAVSKKQPVQAIEELYHLGHRDFGENYVQELVSKAEELKKRGCEDIRWHFIGHLQTNKVKLLIPWAHCIHTVDSEKLAKAIEKQGSVSEPERKKLPIFIEVNLAEESSKSGVRKSEVLEFCKKIVKIQALELKGLMCIPPAGEAAKKWFRELAELERFVRTSTGHSQGQLSMGMSEDFLEAIAEGATYIRVGTALFGPRASKSC